MFASNKAVGGSVADAVEAALGLEVVDRSVSGARYFHALPISGSAGMNLTQQFREGPWDVIIVNGGGNDLLFGCGCGRCDGMLDRLISKDGRKGAIPSFVACLAQDRRAGGLCGLSAQPRHRDPDQGLRPGGK